MTKIKICGLKRECDIEFVNALKPDFIGFIFAKGRKRYIDPMQARILKSKLDGSIKAVGVFVDESEETIAKIAESGAIDLIQLHGSESDSTVARLRIMTGLPIIKAFKISNEADVEAAKCSSADHVLLDNGIGGTGESFDWALIKNFGRPYFLAGGLDSKNVVQAITSLAPFAVDASSGVETDGVKDYNKIKNFIETVRRI